jgi:hypothetical protein
MIYYMEVFPYLSQLTADFFLSHQHWLVVSTHLKNMKVSWDDYSQYMESHKKCSKPSTRTYISYTVIIARFALEPFFWGVELCHLKHQRNFFGEHWMSVRDMLQEPPIYLMVEFGRFPQKNNPLMFNMA